MFGDPFLLYIHYHWSDYSCRLLHTSTCTHQRSIVSCFMRSFPFYNPFEWFFDQALVFLQDTKSFCCLQQHEFITSYVKHISMLCKSVSLSPWAPSNSNGDGSPLVLLKLSYLQAHGPFHEGFRPRPAMIPCKSICRIDSATHITHWYVLHINTNI